ncbi:MAG: DUF2065 domain-containing protein [Alphaproteobacteria bacterium]|nr:DUF2065 domain-containing protein [Alphaproteobacteria bacterium]
MSDFLTAIGLVLVIEGVVYALLPDQAKQALALMMKQPAQTLRIGGLVAVAAGFVIVWAVRNL